MIIPQSPLPLTPELRGRWETRNIVLLLYSLQHAWLGTDLLVMVTVPRIFTQYNPKVSNRETELPLRQQLPAPPPWSARACVDLGCSVLLCMLAAWVRGAHRLRERNGNCVSRTSMWWSAQKGALLPPLEFLAVHITCVCTFGVGLSIDHRSTTPEGRRYVFRYLFTPSMQAIHMVISNITRGLQADRSSKSSTLFLRRRVIEVFFAIYPTTGMRSAPIAPGWSE